MNNMKISTRLAYAFGLILVVVIASALLALNDLSKIQGNLEDVVLDNNVKIRLDHEMSESVHIVSRVMRTVILLDDKAEKEAELGKINHARDNYNKAVETLEKFPASETGRATRAKVAAAAAFARPLNNQVMELALANRDEEARSLMLKSASPAVSKWQEAIDESIASQEKANELQYEVAQTEYKQARVVLIGSNILCLLLAFVGAWLVTRSITRQLGGEPSEAAQLAKSVAEGDLSSRIELKPGDTKSMLYQLKAMQESLVKVVGTVRQGSESVSTASSEIAQGNQDLSARTESQASALEETAASMEELASTVKQNADNAKQANQLAQSASTVAVQGGEVVAQVVGTMKGINDSSKKIADIINVIDGIAFQTNILALNAAVEAARAGEQGRGFAVVAGEVRNLASRSAEAAKEIKTLITDSVSRVQQGSELADRAGSTMNEIVGSIRRVTDIMGEISAASTEQSQGVAQIGEAVQQMDQVTQQNAALVEEMAAAANSLKGQAQDLVQAVAVFKTDHGDAQVSAHSIVASSQALTAAKTAARPAPRPTMTRPALTSHAEPSRAPRATKATDAGAGDWENF